MTMIEVLVTMTVLGAAFVVYSSAVMSTSRQRSASHETTLAADAAQRILELMRSEEFEAVYELYNENPLDDPAGPGTAPGARFDIPGLTAVDPLAEPRVGRVILPGVELEPGVWALHENVQQDELGLPRDLSGDSIIDDQDHTLDYVHLPVRVIVEWRGRSGPRRFELDTLLAEFRR